MLETVLASNPFYRQKFHGIAFDPNNDPIQALPFTQRDELQNDQLAHPPFGTNLTAPIEQYCRYHQTSGTAGAPLRWLDTADSWQWWLDCWKQVFIAAGVTATDRVVFPFSFGPFIGFWAAFESAVRMGCLALPAGGMSSSARIDYIFDNHVTVLCCTPTYALRLAEVAGENQRDLTDSPVQKIIVAGEPGGGIPATRARIESAWTARLFDHAGMTEIGAWGFECAESPGTMHVNEDQFIAEIIDPKTQQSIGGGQPGELVLTNLGRWASPLIRYRTGDLVILSRKPCPCGRSFASLEGGILGRSDDMITIRGNNVFPSAIEGILRQFPELAEFEIEVNRRGAVDEMTVRIETQPDLETQKLDRRVATTIRDQLHFGVKVKIVPSGTLPRYEMKARRVVRRAS